MRPLTEIAPEVGLRMPVMSLRSVLFPEPFGPMRPSVFPLRHGEIDVFQRPKRVARDGPAPKDPFDEEILDRGDARHGIAAVLLREILDSNRGNARFRHGATPLPQTRHGSG